MAKIRVYELANELGVDSRVLLTILKDSGEFVRSASSTLERPVESRIRASLRSGALLNTAQRTTPQIDKSEFGHAQTPPTMLGWRAGEIPPPKDPDLLANIQRVAHEFSEFSQHRDALSDLGSQVVYAKLIWKPRGTPHAIVLVRFSGAIESAFGLTREVMFYYSPYRDFQARDYHAAQKCAGELPHEITPDIFFVSAPDPRLRTKLDDWSKPASRAVPIERREWEPLDFIKLIRSYIYARDLFYETSPVRGSRFFGRRTLLQSLQDDVLNGRVSGLFGLRKAGKTSVLLQLADNLEQMNVITVLVDLEAFPSPPDDPVLDILLDLRRRLVLALKDKGLPTKQLSELQSAFTIVDFKVALQAILAKLGKSPYRIVMMLDEIEYLTPSDKVDIREGAMPSVAQLLGALRSVAQESSNFSFILSGLTSAIIESGRLYGRPNPLFSWAKPYYLAPFERSEADDLATSLGGRMGIEITTEALEALYDASGGHAYLYRNLASTVVAQLPIDVNRRRMIRPDVLRALDAWKQGIAGNVQEMIDHVARHYPDESVLLDVILKEPDDFSELAASEPQALHHLLGLGLVRVEDRSFAPNSLLELM